MKLSKYIITIVTVNLFALGLHGSTLTDWDFLSSDQDTISELKAQGWVFKSNSNEEIDSIAGEGFLRIGGGGFNARATLGISQSAFSGSAFLAVGTHVGGKNARAIFTLKSGNDRIFKIQVFENKVIVLGVGKKRAVFNDKTHPGLNLATIAPDGEIQNLLEINLTWDIDDSGRGTTTFNLSQPLLDPMSLATLNTGDVKLDTNPPGVITNTNASFVFNWDQVSKRPRRPGHIGALYHLMVSSEESLIVEIPDDPLGPIVVIDADVSIASDPLSCAGGPQRNLFVDGDVEITGVLTVGSINAGCIICLNHLVTLTGDITGAGTACFDTQISACAVGANELASTGVTLGIYTFAEIEVDRDGRIISASNGVLPDLSSFVTATNSGIYGGCGNTPTGSTTNVCFGGDLNFNTGCFDFLIDGTPALTAGSSRRVYGCVKPA